MAALLAATTLFLPFALLSLTFLPLAIFVLAALLSGGARLTRFVWIVLFFHNTLCYSLLTSFIAFAMKHRLPGIALEPAFGLEN
jgi:hypothetical protein